MVNPKDAWGIMRGSSVHALFERANSRLPLAAVCTEQHQMEAASSGDQATAGGE